MPAPSYYSRTLAPSTLEIHKLLEKVEAARLNSRTMVTGACRFEGRTLVIPTSVFARMSVPSKAVLEVAFIAGRLMVWTAERPTTTNFFLSTYQKEPEVRLALPDSFPLDEIRDILEHSVAFVGRQQLLVGTPDDVPAELGTTRRVRHVDALPSKMLQRNMLCEANTSFELTRDRVTVWARSSTKGCKYIQLEGGTLSVLGWNPDEPVRVTKYANGVLVEKCASSLASTRLTSRRRNPEWHPKPFMPGLNLPLNLFSESAFEEVFEFVVGDALFVTAGSPELAAVCAPKRCVRHDSRSLCELARPANLKLASTAGGLEPTVYRIGELYFRRGLQLRKGARAGATPNSAVYPVPPNRARLQVQGEWLKDWGFEVGTRYNASISDVLKTPILEPCADGQYTVTAMSTDSDIPKLYVPAGGLPWEAGWVRAIGTPLGLMFRSTGNPREARRARQV